MTSKGQFVISIDYEFALGFADFDLDSGDRERIEDEVVITRCLLVLFEKYNVPATWAVVGHLLETTCTWEGGVAHPEYKRPIHGREKRDWFLHHPPKDEYTNPLWFDSKKLIGEISSSSAGHEIASHSYAHIIYGASDIDERAVAVDLENVKRVHGKAELPVTSFVFPRNKEAQHLLLKEKGFTSYRGVTKKWFEPFPGFWGRGLRLIDYYLPTYRIVRAVGEEGGLINIPDSMMLLSRNGLRKLVTAKQMKRKAIGGIKKAVKRGEIFHLWFHPSNFWYDADTQFDILEGILKEAFALRAKGKLEIVTMREVASTL